jgi:RNA polymerase sigma-70 factor (ECF subfamily)
MREVQLDELLVSRLHGRASASRWAVSVDRFRASLAASAARTFADGPPRSDQIERHLSALHLEDLALACGCAEGHDAAWEHFVREHRPALYRAADALDRTGGARELADALYAELFGLTERDGKRLSLFRYFHGRSSLATWLRAVLAQRYVDGIRSARRLDPLPADDGTGALPASGHAIDSERARFHATMSEAIKTAVARLGPKDRLRLSCYYAQGLTLAQIGRGLGEHEATTSRHLARTRRDIRDDVDRQLRHEHGMGDAAVEECFASVVDDAGALDLAEMLSGGPVRKNVEPDRST